MLLAPSSFLLRSNLAGAFRLVSAAASAHRGPGAPGVLSAPRSVNQGRPHRALAAPGASAAAPGLLHQPSGARMASQGAWAGGSQTDLMLKDQCIVVDEQDCIAGSSNKHACHRFEGQQPQGQLHRAFSVFLFDDAGRLLLQQRAREKITFPSVWTNTCCSHPLVGQQPDEVDLPDQILDGSVPGVRNAAVRKLQHELGIPEAQVPLDSFRFLTRLHYCAADTDTWGPNAEWGEHEVDYILFIQANVTLKPNPEEVDEVRYVTQQELAEMMQPSSGLRWSPWFRIIAERFLPQWWADLGGVLTSNRHADWPTIHHILNPKP